MARTYAQAAKLLSATEMTLFVAAQRDGIGKLSSRALQSKIERARRLRDKYRDLFTRQRLATRARTGTKPGRSGAANERTEAKAKLFDELVTRFAARLEHVEAAERRAVLKAESARTKAARKPAKAAGTAKGPGKSVSPKAPARVTTPGKAAGGAIGGAGFMNARAKGIDTKLQLHVSRGKAIQAHLRSAGRRSQARRDGRSR
jgi:hypothetical protein